ncbi:hypothetical protein HMEPL2_27420 [Vreelandella aquamarina]|uniref:Uncharacterized protein n=1 Tax=Vreelandella aquamarina TaxID=77097 RepID=A0A6F8XDC2_9GAMM|nr:hypothetical protein [Halomonas meridiana]BCB72391.1 hypothetical protein HMEPL2_27420 [Halomonas meridiana]
MDFTPEPLDITLPPLDFTAPAIDLDTVPPFDVEPLPAKEAET